MKQLIKDLPENSEVYFSFKNEEHDIGGNLFVNPSATIELQIEEMLTNEAKIVLPDNWQNNTTMTYQDKTYQL